MVAAFGAQNPGRSRGTDAVNMPPRKKKLLAKKAKNVNLEQEDKEEQEEQPQEVETGTSSISEAETPRSTKQGHRSVSTPVSRHSSVEEIGRSKSQEPRPKPKDQGPSRTTSPSPASRQSPAPSAPVSRQSSVETLKTVEGSKSPEGSKTQVKKTKPGKYFFNLQCECVSLAVVVECCPGNVMEMNFWVHGNVMEFHGPVVVQNPVITYQCRLHTPLGKP